MARNHHEAIMQSAFFHWLGFYKKLRKTCWGNMNGGQRTNKAGHFAKLSGLTPGVPDVTIAIPTASHPGLFIEFKVKGGRLTPEQKEMIADLIDRGYAVHVCYSFEEAQDVLINYLAGSPYAIKRPVSHLYYSTRSSQAEPILA